MNTALRAITLAAMLMPLAAFAGDNTPAQPKPVKPDSAMKGPVVIDSVDEPDERMPQETEDASEGDVPASDDKSESKIEDQPKEQ